MNKPAYGEWLKAELSSRGITKVKLSKWLKISPWFLGDKIKKDKFNKDQKLAIAYYFKRKIYFK